MARSNSTKKQEGQLLVEAIVAVSLMLVGLLGVFSVLSRSLGLSRVAADQFVAVNLASEGIEIAKNILDGNIKQGIAWNSGGFSGSEAAVDYMSQSLVDCDDSGDLYLIDGLYTCDEEPGVSSRFNRKLFLETEPGGEVVKVRSVVEWRERGGFESSVEVEDHFYNWRDLR